MAAPSGLLFGQHLPEPGLFVGCGPIGARGRVACYRRAIHLPEPDSLQWIAGDASGESDVYRIENGQRRLFVNGNVYLSHGYNWSEIAPIDQLWQDGEMASYPAGPAITYRNGTIIRCPDETACPHPDWYWVIENGYKRHFISGGRSNARAMTTASWRCHSPRSAPFQTDQISIWTPHSSMALLLSMLW